MERDLSPLAIEGGKSTMLRMEALPMITPKNLAEGMEFLITLVLSAVAGLLAFLFVSLVVNILGLSGS
ncbi:MAG: hypothetical protein M3Y84_10560 [Acidobacteriota bacterium]|nr:hypothetical protein [Acidobacteriota bacterium]